MIQLKILSGSRKGTVHLAREFPCAIGRSASASLRLEEPGIWDQHLRLILNSPEGFQLEVHSGAIASVNGKSCQQVRLRNGDLIEIGSVKMQFWLSEVEQPSLRPRERFTWALIILLGLVQVGLVVWLLG